MGARKCKESTPQGFDEASVACPARNDEDVACPEQVGDAAVAEAMHDAVASQADAPAAGSAGVGDEPGDLGTPGQDDAADCGCSEAAADAGAEDATGLGANPALPCDEACACAEGIGTCADEDGDTYDAVRERPAEEGAPVLLRRDARDEDVARAQELLGGCWHQDGSAVLACPERDEDEPDDEDDLGRFDIHDPHQLGELGEHIAARYLRMYDYKILERNYRCRQGEADIICTRDDMVVLVEVKTRLGEDAHPEEAVNASKLQRYKRITLDYLMRHEWFENVRLDVLAVNIVEPHRAQVHHFVGVCAWEG